MMVGQATGAWFALLFLDKSAIFCYTHYKPLERRRWVEYRRSFIVEYHFSIYIILSLSLKWVEFARIWRIHSRFLLALAWQIPPRICWAKQSYKNGSQMDVLENKGHNSLDGLCYALSPYLYDDFSNINANRFLYYSNGASYCLSFDVISVWDDCNLAGSIHMATVRKMQKNQKDRSQICQTRYW